MYNMPVVRVKNIVLALSLMACSLLAENTSKLLQPYIETDAYGTQRFYNYKGEKPEAMETALRIFFAEKTNLKPYFSAHYRPQDWIAHDTPPTDSITPCITWLGHATFLIQLGTINILTDPHFYDMPPLFPRKTPVGIEPEKLPRIDIVLISHNHRDHFDTPSLKFLEQRGDKPLILTGLGGKSYLHPGTGTWRRLFSHDFKTDVTTLNWWENHVYKSNKFIKATVPQTVNFTFVPAIHWSNRSAFDRNTWLWGGWIIEYDGFKIYFAGDTAYGDGTHFEQIAAQFKPIDVALLPIGPNEPRQLLKSSHMSAAEAVQAFKLLDARTFIPMHWGTFELGTDSFEDAPQQLLSAWEQLAAPDKQNKKLTVAKFGQCLDFSLMAFIQNKLKEPRPSRLHINQPPTINENTSSNDVSPAATLVIPS
jgi:L-ascorbate metabolism protein UlaG (beta-lactamase superfamily)